MLAMLRSIFAETTVPGNLRSTMGRASPELGGILLFEEVTGAIHLATLQVAALASGVNAIGKSRLKMPLELRNLVPAEPAVMAQIVRCRDELEVARKVIDTTGDFVTELPPAREKIGRFCEDIEALGSDKACFFHLLGLMATSRRLAQRAYRAVEALDPEVRRCLPMRYGLNTRLLTKLLADTMAGGQPCVDPEGNLFLPELPQRRPSSRRNVSLPCTVEHEGRNWRAVVQDVSTGGLGLERAHKLTPQKVVLVEFEDHRCLSGMVVWARGHLAGVKLDTPLKPTDPLLMGAS